MKENVIKFFHLQGDFTSDEKFDIFIVLLQQFMNMNLEIPFTSTVILFVITSVCSQTCDFGQYMIHCLLTTVHYAYDFLRYHILFIILFHYLIKSCFLPRNSFLFTCLYFMVGNTDSFCGHPDTRWTVIYWNLLNYQDIIFQSGKIRFCVLLFNQYWNLSLLHTFRFECVSVRYDWSVVMNCCILAIFAQMCADNYSFFQWYDWIARMREFMFLCRHCR